MHHKVIDALAAITPHERLVIYKESVSILLQKDLAMFDIIFDNFESTMDQNTSTTNTDLFADLLVSNLRVTIEEFGVYLNQDMLILAAVEPLTYVAKMLYMYDRYDDQHLLLGLLEGEYSSNELIGVLTAAMTEYDKVQEILPLIEEVSSALIKKMRKTSEETMAAMENLSEYSQEELERVGYLARLSEAWDIRKPYELLSLGWRFGQDIGDYAIELLPADSAKTDPITSAKLIVLSAVMANVPVLKLKEAAGTYVQERFDEDPATMVAIGRALGNLNFGAV